MSARRRLALVLAAALLAGCGGSEADDGSKPAASQRTGGLGSWRVVAEGPLGPRSGQVAIWTGEEMVVWGGSARSDSQESLDLVAARDGAAYDPESDSWRRISRAPIPGGFGYSAVWTGDEMIVWGGVGRHRRGETAAAAAYHLDTDTWRIIADAPLTPRAGHLAVWTGKEMVVWGGFLTAYERERYDGEGAAYDPATDSWRMLPRAPLPAGYDAMGAWTGREIVVLATRMGDEPTNAPKQAQAAAYEPGRDTWRRTEQPPMAAYVSPPAVTVAGELFLLSLGGTVDGGEVNGYARSYPTGGIYSVAQDEWRLHADPPEHPNQTWPQVAMGDEVVIDGLAYDPRDDSWRPLPGFPLAPREFPSLIWTGEELIVWGGAERPEGNVIVDPPPLLGDGAAYKPPFD
jgi:hypothetical protein